MDFLAFVKKWSLLCSLCFGIAVYVLFANVPLLQPVGDIVGPFAVSLLSVVLFMLLYVTFCKIQIEDMRPRAWHFWLQTIRITLSGLLVWIITQTEDATTKLILEGVFICVICPTAAAAAVVTEKLGGSIASMTIYTIIANVVTSIIIPLFFPMVERSADISFLVAMSAVLRNVTIVLVVPLVLALLSRKFIPRFTDKIREMKNLGFYMWCFNLAIVSGLTFRNILHSSVTGKTLFWLLVLPLVVALVLFSIGKIVGHAYGDSVSAGQALGQKNTVVGIWLTVTFLNPLAAVAPGAYVLWQNLINAWQIWYKEKYGELKW
ncbi:MAG: bile acid:sodium symporter [Prevotella sp.]|nr:bile acid:sodium symporter [Prevotella sp.]